MRHQIPKNLWTETLQLKSDPSLISEDFNNQMIYQMSKTPSAGPTETLGGQVGLVGPGGPWWTR